MFVVVIFFFFLGGGGSEGGVGVSDIPDLFFLFVNSK